MPAKSISWCHLILMKKCHCIMRAIPWEFWDEVFSLKIWGHFIQQCIYRSKTTQNLPPWFGVLPEYSSVQRNSRIWDHTFEFYKINWTTNKKDNWSWLISIGKMGYCWHHNPLLTRNRSWILTIHKNSYPREGLKVFHPCQSVDHHFCLVSIPIFCWNDY